MESTNTQSNGLHGLAHNDLGAAWRGKESWTRPFLISERQPSPDLSTTENCTTAHENLGTALQLKGRTAEAIASFQEAIRLRPDNAYTQNGVAWFLATCQDPHLRDPKQAVSYAERATALAPYDWMVWNTLGVAQYRNGDDAAAIAALNRSIRLRNGGNDINLFFLAMAHWRLGHQDTAPQYYARANEMMHNNSSNEDDSSRFRDEAAALLGVAELPADVFAGPVAARPEGG